MSDGTKNQIIPAGLGGATWLARLDYQTVADRLGRIPLDDPENIAAQMQGPLLWMRQTRLAVARRFEFLGLLARPLGVLIYSVHALQGAYPLTGGTRRLAQAAYGVFVDSLAGYLQCLMAERTEGLFGLWRHRNLWPICAHHAVTLMGLVAETAGMLDRNTPPGLWAELARVRRQAEAADWLNTELPSIRSPGHTTSIEWEYRRILLLSQIHPSELDFRSSGELMTILGRCAASLEPIAPRNGRAPVGLVGFGVMRGVDRPPMPIRPRFLAPGAPDMRYWESLHDASALMEDLALWLNGEGLSDRQHVNLGDEAIRRTTLQLLWRRWFGDELPAAAAEAGSADAGPDSARGWEVGGCTDIKGDEEAGKGMEREWAARMERLDHLLEADGCFFPLRLKPDERGGARCGAGTMAISAPCG